VADGDTGFDAKVFILSEDVAFNQALSRDRELRELAGNPAGRDPGFLDRMPGWHVVPGIFRRGTRGRQRCQPGFAFRGPARAAGETARRPATDSSGCLDRRARPRTGPEGLLVGISVALGIAGIAALAFDLGVDRHQVVRANIPILATWITVGVIGSLLADDVRVASSPRRTPTPCCSTSCWRPRRDAGPPPVARPLSTMRSSTRACPQQLPVQVVNTEKRKRRRSTSYYLHVERWPDPRGNTEVRIDEQDFRWIQPGSCITVTWHPGRLGDGWVSGYRAGCPDAADVEK
jgi:hypothetical protein